MCVCVCVCVCVCIHIADALVGHIAPTGYFQQSNFYPFTLSLLSFEI